MELKLFVRNLSFRTTDSELCRLFQQHGEVLSARRATDNATGRQRGFGFVEMTLQADAEKAIGALHNQDFDARTLFVAVWQPEEPFRESNNRSWE